MSKGGLFTIYNVLIKEKEKLIAKISDTQNKLKSMPAENLCCAKNGPHYKWYSCLNTTTNYISKKNRRYAEKLALKKYYQLELEGLKKELNAIDVCLSHYPSTKISDDFLECNPEYQNLLSGIVSTSNASAALWLTEEYDNNKNYPEGLKFKTNQGSLVRSKSEVIIANILSSHNIPFRYECGLNLNGMIIYPDFTIMHPVTNQIFYWEHFGLIDNPSYAHSAMTKLQTYMTNNIFPSINLITSYETKDNPLDISMIEEIVKYYFI